MDPDSRTPRALFIPNTDRCFLVLVEKQLTEKLGQHSIHQLLLLHPRPILLLLLTALPAAASAPAPSTAPAAFPAAVTARRIRRKLRGLRAGPSRDLHERVVVLVGLPVVHHLVQVLDIWYHPPTVVHAPGDGDDDPAALLLVPSSPGGRGGVAAPRRQDLIAPLPPPDDGAADAAASAVGVGHHCRPAHVSVWMSEKDDPQKNLYIWESGRSRLPRRCNAECRDWPTKPKRGTDRKRRRRSTCRATE